MPKKKILKEKFVESLKQFVAQKFLLDDTKEKIDSLEEEILAELKRGKNTDKTFLVDVNGQEVTVSVAQNFFSGKPYLSAKTVEILE